MATSTPGIQTPYILRHYFNIWMTNARQEADETPHSHSEKYLEGQPFCAQSPGGKKVALTYRSSGTF